MHHEQDQEKNNALVVKEKIYNLQADSKLMDIWLLGTYDDLFFKLPLLTFGLSFVLAVVCGNYITSLGLSFIGCYLVLLAVFLCIYLKHKRHENEAQILNEQDNKLPLENAKDSELSVKNKQDSKSSLKKDITIRCYLNFLLFMSFFDISWVGLVSAALVLSFLPVSNILIFMGVGVCIGSSVCNFFIGGAFVLKYGIKTKQFQVGTESCNYGDNIHTSKEQQHGIFMKYRVGYENIWRGIVKLVLCSPFCVAFFLSLVNFDVLFLSLFLVAESTSLLTEAFFKRKTEEIYQKEETNKNQNTLK